MCTFASLGASTPTTRPESPRRIRFWRRLRCDAKSAVRLLLAPLLVLHSAAASPASSAAAAPDAREVLAGSNKFEPIVNDFIATTKAKAALAYDELFDDGFGLDGGAAPSRETFVSRYLSEALTRETRKVLIEKGYAPPDRREKKSFTDVEKKDAPSTLEGEVERMAVQKRQRRAVRERVRANKAIDELLPGHLSGSARRAEYGSTASGHDILNQSADYGIWEVACGESLYRRHVYDTIPGCSAGPPVGPSCQRLIIDNFTTAEEWTDMVATMDHAFQHLFHQGVETLLVPEQGSRNRLGEPGFLLIGRLLERMRVAIAQALNISEIFYSGSLLKRMDYPPLLDELQVDANHDSSNPHVDKANIASYDWSALLYFSSTGADYGGGELVFHDPDKDRLVRPLAGRLVAFSSGLENLHRVLPMTWGRRYTLAVWFTCSAGHAHPSLSSTKEEGRGVPAIASGRHDTEL